MRLSQELNVALVNQIHEELQNANIYRQISCFFEDLQLKNLAKYFLDASKEETEHADKFMQHINDRAGGRVSISEVDSPNLNITTLEEVCNLHHGSLRACRAKGEGSSWQRYHEGTPGDQATQI